MTFTRIPTVAMVCAALLLGACGGGGSDSASQPIVQAAACNPADPTTSAACGTVLLGLTDADGDFLAYTVDISQLTLETPNGRTVEVLPTRTRVNYR